MASGLGCRLGCCLPVADAQHRPEWQRRPATRQRPTGTLRPFEKVGKTFTCLHPAFAEGPALAERKKAACPVRPRTGVRDLSAQALGAGFPVSGPQQAPPPLAACASCPVRPRTGVRDLRAQALRRGVGYHTPLVNHPGRNSAWRRMNISFNSSPRVAMTMPATARPRARSPLKPSTEARMPRGKNSTLAPK